SQQELLVPRGHGDEDPPGQSTDLQLPELVQVRGNVDEFDSGSSSKFLQDWGEIRDVETLKAVLMHDNPARPGGANRSACHLLRACLENGNVSARGGQGGSEGSARVGRNGIRQGEDDRC